MTDDPKPLRNVTAYELEHGHPEGVTPLPVPGPADLFLAHTPTPADPSIVRRAGQPDTATCATCGAPITAYFGDPWEHVREDDSP